MSSNPDVGAFQERAFPEDFDYTPGSPHLQHSRLRGTVEASLAEEVGRLISRFGRCRVMEVGAGHGHFTRGLIGAGASVTVTEMSKPAADRLRLAFADDEDVVVVEDADGSWAFTTEKRFELVAAISVLHHIPDYLTAVARYAALTEVGGSFISWQDPLWYPRLPRSTRAASKAAYLTWRLGQGNWRRGLATLRRRMQGILDETEVSDMSEYHVVRHGVDERVLRRTLGRHFEEVRLTPYWSTQAGPLQTAGSRLKLLNTFGLLARERRAGSSGHP